MNWLFCTIGTLILWGTYTIFANKANLIHGDKITLLFEAAAFVVLALAVSGSSRSDFHRVTIESAVYATIMAIMSAGGFYLLLMAFNKAPERFTMIAFSTAMYPVITVIVASLILKFKPELMAEAKAMTPVQFFGVVMAITGLVLINWDSAWTAKLRALL